MRASVSIANVSKVFPGPRVASPTLAATPAEPGVPAPGGKVGRAHWRIRRTPREPHGAQAAGGLEALRGVTVDIRPGEFLSVLGPSGCGKTTLLRIVGGLAEPTSGTVRIGGRNAAEAQRHKLIGCVFQEPALLPWRTVLDNVRLPLAVNRAVQRPGGRRPEELLDLVRLAEFAGYYPGQLSRGMQQRVGLARALALDPALLLMDEPFASLDEITREHMRFELLRIWDAARKTVLFVTHSIVDAVLLSDRVAVLSARPGRVRAVLPIELRRPRVAGIEHTPEFSAAFRRVHDLVMAEAA
ncbi:MAG: ABC transporter ATP-binding protein [Spirochaetaceae bacterium]|nr:ABC transporter ATP-binding protein [Spirochaetaceae bacterium]